MGLNLDKLIRQYTIDGAGEAPAGTVMIKNS